MIGINDVLDGGLCFVISVDDYVVLLCDFVMWVCGFGVIFVLQILLVIDVCNVFECGWIGEFVVVVCWVVVDEDVIFVDQYVCFVEFGDGGVLWGLMNDFFYFGVVGYVVLVQELVCVFGICLEGLCVCIFVFLEGIVGMVCMNM